MSYITDNHAYNTSNPQFRYTYSTYEGSSNGFEITLHYKFSTDFVKGMQNVTSTPAVSVQDCLTTSTVATAHTQPAIYETLLIIIHLLHEKL